MENAANDSESFGLTLEIEELDYVLLPIPQKHDVHNVLMEINLRIKNSTDESVRLDGSGVLRLELLDPSNRTLAARGSNAQSIFNGSLAGSKSFILAALQVRLFWENNDLKLQIINTSVNDDCWTFNATNPGLYKLRFMYLTTAGNLKAMRRIQLTTEFINLRITETSKKNEASIEDAQVRFQVFTNKKTFNIPEEGSDSKTPIRFGINITNLSPNPYYFVFRGLIPEIKDSKSKIIYPDYNRNVTVRLEESHFLLAMSGETLTYLLDGELYWNRNRLMMRGFESSGGVWLFQNLKSGVYGVRFRYKGLSQAAVSRLLNGVVMHNIWTGVAVMPFTQFQLVE